jgi:hypothetical protein
LAEQKTTPKEKIMSDESVDVVDSGASDSGNVDVGSNGGDSESSDNFGALQDRMSSDSGSSDSAWYSDSVDEVVDGNTGETLLDANGKPYKGEGAFERYLADQKNKTAKPKTDVAKSVENAAPMHKDFKSFINGGKPLTIEQLQKLAEVSSKYEYKDQLLPKVDPQIIANRQQEQLDPIKRISETRKTHEQTILSQFQKVKDALVSNGATEEIAIQILEPILQDEVKGLEGFYASQIESAKSKNSESGIMSKITDLEKRALADKGKVIYDSVAKEYYPEGGADQLDALLNGYRDETGNFKRGPAAGLVDLLAYVANDGKAFGTHEDRVTSYASMMLKLKTNEQVVRKMTDLAHNYWIGKNIASVKRRAFDEGRNAALAQVQRQKQTIKTPPANYGRSNAGANDGLPKSVQRLIGA